MAQIVEALMWESGTLHDGLEAVLADYSIRPQFLAVRLKEYQDLNPDGVTGQHSSARAWRARCCRCSRSGSPPYSEAFVENVRTLWQKAQAIIESG